MLEYNAFKPSLENLLILNEEELKYFLFSIQNMTDFENSVLISNRIDTDQFCQERKIYLENQPSSKFYSENMFQKRTKKLIFILIIILICVSLVKYVILN